MSMLEPTQGGYGPNRRLYNQGESYTIWDALKVDDAATVESLIKDHNLNPNQSSRQGNTFAFIASKSGAYNCLKLLIGLGAAVSETDLEAALDSNHCDCVQLLLNFLEPGQQKNSIPMEEKKTSYEAKFSQMEEQICQQKESLERQQELINQLMLKQQEEAISNSHNNKGGVGIIYILKADELKAVIRSYLSAKDLKILQYVNQFFRSCFEVQKIACIKTKEVASVSSLGRLSELGNKEQQVKVGQLSCEPKRSDNKSLNIKKVLANDDVDKLGVALKNGFNPNTLFADGLTLVFFAAKRNSVKCLQLLINAKADVNQPDQGGNTPAYIAADSGHDKCLKLLIAAKANINRPNKYGYTPTYNAVRGGYDKCLNLLIEAKADVNNRPNELGTTPAWIAAQFSREKCLKLLIEAKADVNRPDKYGTTPTWIAAWMGAEKCLKCLIEAKADINRPDKEGRTPAYVAAQYGREKCLKCLIEAKADINRPKKHSATSICIEDFYLETYIEAFDESEVDFLMYVMADTNLSKEGETPMSAAVHYGHDKCLKLLIDAKADINSLCKWGKPLRRIVSEKKRYKCAKLLAPWVYKAYLSAPESWYRIEEFGQNILNKLFKGTGLPGLFIIKKRATLPGNLDVESHHAAFTRDNKTWEKFYRSQQKAFNTLFRKANLTTFKVTSWTG